MALQILDIVEADRPTVGEAEEPHHTDILRQMERIASSSLFSKSKRYPSFLRYIVEHTLAGRTDLLKERTLGIEVFNRPNDYDTNADPVVRITAGEIRKRLAQYYQTPGHEAELRIDLPIGSYAPLFSRPAHEHIAPASHPVSQPVSRPEPEPDPEPFASATLPSTPLPSRSFPETSPLQDPAPVPAEVRVHDAAVSALIDPAAVPAVPETGHSQAFWLTLTSLLLLFALSMAALALVPMWTRSRESGIAGFWNSIFHAENPALIVVGVHSFGPDGKDLSPVNAAQRADESMLSSMTSADMIPLSDVVSYGKITDLLTRYAHPYKTQSATETTFGQLQPGPVLLLGGLDNFWTMRFTSALRFRFAGQSCPEGAILDAQHPGTAWHFNSAQNARSNSQDYAIVANFFDPQIEQRILIAAGIGKSGTAAAASFITNNHYLQTWASQAHVPRGKNVELVLSTEIIQGQQGPPHVIAWTTW